MTSFLQFSEEEAILKAISLSERRFSIDEIIEATNNFDPETIFSSSDDLGFKMYVANLSNSESNLSYVKRFSKSNFCFESEVLTMMKNRKEFRTNLLTFYGCCIESDELILVYKYMENGSLSDYLNNKGIHKIWSWKKRVNVCLNIAYGLQHLHAPTIEFIYGMAHGVLKTTDILVDKNWNPYISNFNNFGDLDRSSIKPADVYELGTILIDLLCWDNQSFRAGFNTPRKHVNDFRVLAKQKVARDSADEISPDSLNAFSDAIWKCSQLSKFERPTIDKVVLDLEAALKFQDLLDSQTIPATLDFPNSSSSTGTDESISKAISKAISLSQRRFSIGKIINCTNNFDPKTIFTSSDDLDFKIYVTNLSNNNLHSIESNLSYVKRFSTSSGSGNCLSFCKEVLTITKIRKEFHTNFLPFYGCCIESDEKILVYKYMENGCLSDYLNKGHKVWSWKMRVNICLKIAYGLKHLHEPTDEFPYGIDHGVFKTTDILLDENWNPIISNFNKRGYNILGCSKPADVYELGNILIDVLCWNSKSLRAGFDRSHEDDFRILAKKKVALESGDELSPDSLNAFSDAIWKCSELNKYKRPTIKTVVLDLEAALKFQELFESQTIPTLDLPNSSSRDSRMMGEIAESDSLDELNEVTNNSKKIISSSSLRISRMMGEIVESDLLDELNEVTNNSKKIISSSSLEISSSSSSSSSFNPSTSSSSLNSSTSSSSFNSSTSSSSFNSSTSSSLQISSSTSSSSLINLFSPSYRQFSLGTINKVTNNLDKEKSLRVGTYWIEYLVQMNLDSKIEKTWAVVKQFNVNCTDKFEKEIRMVTKIQAHPNLTSLLGYCVESDENILIYSYTEHGSLIDYVKLGSHICLSWKERLKICFGAALALQHLHKVTSEFQDGLIHGDVNPANILLDKNWVAKVSNYAGSHVVQIRPSFSTNTVKDPFTRYAPEYETSNHLTKRGDVYAFGIVLFQVLCRRGIWVEGEESMLGYIEENYARWAKENVDIAIKNGISEDSLRAYTDCIGRCLESNPYKRPTMQRVVGDIETALSFQEDEGEDIDLSASFCTKSRIIEGVAMSSVSFSLSSSSCRRFPLTEIKDATNNFAVEKRLGKGGEGTVYLAEIYLNSITEKAQVAVKLLNKDYIGEFEKEIVTVAKIKHPNIVSLLGYCRESDEKVLIYEYMGKGSLADYVKVNSEICLSWKQRLNICLGAAYGLQHLHGETEEFPYGIIHRDIKPENILINDKWDAKVSDFGMLKLSNVSQVRSTFITVHARGTPGYFAPECSILSEKQLTRKIDVYSFGLVMFEVLCLKRRWDIGDQSVYLEQNEDVALLAYENIDINIKHQMSEDSKYVFIDIIAASLRADPKRRPTMNYVVHNLEVALKYQEQSEVSNEINVPF